MSNTFLLIAALLCWSPTWYVIKFQLGYVDPIISVFYRFFFASLIIFAFLIFQKRNLIFSMKHHLWFIVLGVTLYSLNYVFFYNANTYLISAFPAVVFSTLVIMNIVGERICFKKKITLETGLGAILGVLGVMIIFKEEIFIFDWKDETHIGIILAFIATFWASTGNMIHQRNTKAKFPVMESTAYGMMYGAISTLLIAKISGIEVLYEYTWSYTLALAYLSIIGTVFGFYFYLKLLDNVGSGKAGYIGVIMPVTALLISTIFENLEWKSNLIIGLPILLIGAILILRQKKTVTPIA